LIPRQFFPAVAAKLVRGKILAEIAADTANHGVLDMKLVIAYLPPQPLQKIINALADQHIHGLTVSNAKGFGQEHDPDHPEYREFEGIDMTRKIRLEIACHDEEVAPILATLYAAAHTGHRGDGKVFVLPMEDALRLKTGERGAAALGPKHPRS
jgi:nitrogen regulatory protein PII